MELYSKSYSKLLMKSKYCLRGDEENEDEEGPSDKIPPPERQTIGFAQENAPRTPQDWNKYFDTSAYEEDPQKRLKTEDSSVAPMNMMEARTISYRDSMAKLFPNPQDAMNATLPPSGGNPMASFPGLKQNNPLLMSLLQNKGGAEGPNNGISPIGRGMMSTPPNPLHTMTAGIPNPAIGRFPNAQGGPVGPNAQSGQPGRGPNYNMDPMLRMMYNNKMNQFNQMNMMNHLGQRGQAIGGMPNFQQMMMATKDGDPSGMSAERMQAMMQSFQQQQYQQQMYQNQGGDPMVKTEGLGDNWNASDINVKVQVDDEEHDAGTEERAMQRRHNNGNRRGNDINVKDEESVN